jgi:hypothetical protein
MNPLLTGMKQRYHNPASEKNQLLPMNGEKGNKVV